MFQLYKKAYSGISPTSWWLSMIIFVNRCGSMVLPFLTIYLTQSLHFSIGQAGLVMTCFGSGAIIGALAGGQLADRIGFYAVQFWSLIGNGILFIVLGQMHTLPAICATIFIMACIGEAFRPANSMAIAVYSDPETRTRAYSLNRLAINLGFCIGPAVGGILASIGYQWLFWVDGLTCICAALLMRVFIKPVKTAPKPEKIKQNLLPKDSPYRDGYYIFFIAMVTLFAVCFLQMSSIAPVYFKQVLHLREVAIGLYFSLNGLIIVFVEMILIYKLEGKRPNLWFISMAATIMSIGFVILNIPMAVPLVALGFVSFITFGEIFGMPFMNAFWINRSQAHNRGQYASLYTIAYSIANIVAPTLGSQVVQHFGFTIWWWCAAALCVATGAGFWGLLRVMNRGEQMALKI